MKVNIIILLFAVVIIGGTALADENGHQGHDHEGTSYGSPTETVTVTRIGGNLGLLALAASGNQLDWGVPPIMTTANSRIIIFTFKRRADLQAARRNRLQNICRSTL